MPVERLKKFLDDNRIKYITIKHSMAFTAQEIAHTAHISGKELAKVVMVKLDDKLAMTVLPASSRIDFTLIKKATNTTKIELATELEFKHVFPGCEVGAMPPFGNLYGIQVYCASILAEDEEIAFNAGNHTELIRLSFHDFKTLVQPKIVEFTTKYKS
jgi:Ala-tRNA(Pro) deacylase